MRSEPLEILSAVAVHLCLLFLISGGGRGGGRGVQTLFWCHVSLLSRKPLLFICTHTHAHTSDSVEGCSLCYGIWEALPQLLPPVQSATTAPVLFYFPFPPSSPHLSGPAEPECLLFFSSLFVLLSITFRELFIHVRIVFVCPPPYCHYQLHV